MKKYLESITLKTGLAIFAMLFGAGNLIFPCSIGILSGNLTPLGLFAFILTGVLIPLTGLIGMVFFDGNYHEFFQRIGKIPGNLLIFFWMLIIGPLLVMPRIISFCFEMVKPFVSLPLYLKNYGISEILLFSTIFATLVFFFAYRKSSLIEIIGKVLSPLKLLSLVSVIMIGILTKSIHPAVTTSTMWDVFKCNLLLGYNTLDLPGSIFFAYIVISILKEKLDPQNASDKKALAKIMINGSLIAGTLLALIYIGMGYLGYWHGQEFANLNAGQMFASILMKILGSYGALILSVTVLLACFTTIIALSSVVTEYVYNDVSNKKIPYWLTLASILVLTAFMSQFELGPILKYSAPLMNIAYPVLIILTFCNIAYKLWNFSYVKLPVFVTLILSIFWFAPDYKKLLSQTETEITKDHASA